MYILTTKQSLPTARNKAHIDWQTEPAAQTNNRARLLRAGILQQSTAQTRALGTSGLPLRQ
jgi:hypothetical protein